MAKRNIESAVATILVVGGLLLILILFLRAGALTDILKAIRKLALFDFLNASSRTSNTEYDETVNKERKDDESNTTNPSGGGSGTNEGEDKPTDSGKTSQPDQVSAGNEDLILGAVAGGAGATALALALDKYRKSHSPKGGGGYGGSYYGSGIDPSRYGGSKQKQPTVQSQAYEDIILKSKSGKDYTVKSAGQELPADIPRNLAQLGKQNLPTTTPTPTAKTPSRTALEEATKISSPLRQNTIDVYKPITDFFGNIRGFIEGIPNIKSPIFPVGISPIIAPAPIPVPLI